MCYITTDVKSDMVAFAGSQNASHGAKKARRGRPFSYILFLHGTRRRGFTRYLQFLVVYDIQS